MICTVVVRKGQRCCLLFSQFVRTDNWKGNWGPLLGYSKRTYRFIQQDDKRSYWWTEEHVIIGYNRSSTCE